jgi:flagellar FliL protein
MDFDSQVLNSITGGSFMAEERTEETHHEPEKGKKGLLIIIILLTIVVAGVLGYVFVFGKHTSPEKEQQTTKKEQKSALIPLDPFVLNLLEQGRFLKVSMQFEITDESQREFVMSKIPQLRDAIITLVSSKSIESIASPEGKMQLKDELLLRANQVVGKEVFKNLYFTEFLIQ